jgi:hypothetical protein
MAFYNSNMLFLEADYMKCKSGKEPIRVKNIFVVISKVSSILILKINKVMASLAKLLTCVRKPK